MTISKEDLTKTSRQLRLSMGGMAVLFQGFGVIMFALLLYLLSKVVIEKNAQSISMAKILGYSDKEINRLYIVPPQSYQCFTCSDNRVMYCATEGYL